MGKLIVFTRYSSNGASSRLRHLHYMHTLSDAGIDAVHRPLFPRGYLASLYAGKRVNPFTVLLAYVTRLFQLVRMRSQDAMVIEYELFPYVPYFVERLLIGRRKYILDFDDNVWDKYKGIPFLRRKYDKLVSRAAGVIVANDFLRKQVERSNGNTIKIPTTIRLKAIPLRTDQYRRFTMVWIGTPITFQKYVLPRRETLRRMSQRVKFDLMVVSAVKPEQIPGVRMRFRRWSPDNEYDIMSKCHVGIMPLDNDDFSLGKSAYKLIQYCGAGLPCIASPVGENVNVVEHGGNGFLVDTPDDAINALVELYENPGLRQSFSTRSREIAKRYDLDAWKNTYVSFVSRSLYGNGRHPL